MVMVLEQFTTGNSTSAREIQWISLLIAVTFWFTESAQLMDTLLTSALKNKQMKIVINTNKMEGNWGRLLITYCAQLTAAIGNGRSWSV